LSSKSSTSHESTQNLTVRKNRSSYRKGKWHRHLYKIHL